MRFRLIAIVLVVIIVAVLALPAIAWAMMPEPEPAVDAQVTVTFKAYRASATDYSKAGFSIEWSVAAEPEKVAYWSYIGQWWGNIISPGQAAVPGSFPFVAMTVVDANNSYQRVIPDDYEPYTYGDHFEESFTFTIPHGHKLLGQVQIYHAQSASIYISQYWVVP